MCKKCSELAMEIQREKTLNGELHICEVNSPSGLYGSAINTCYEDSSGHLWVTNGEYESGVNYCPFCGFKAPKGFAETE